MPKKVKSTKAAAKVITAETKKATSSYQDEVNTKTLDLIDTVSENVTIQSERIDIISQRIDIISNRLDKVYQRVGII